MKSLWLILPLLSLATLSHAQERTAAGAAETQMTWASLSTLINAANTKIDGVNSRVDQVVVCANKGRVYTPGKAGADAQGCSEAATTAATQTNITNLQNGLTTVQNNLGTTTNNVTSIINCNKSGQIFNGSGCIAPASSVPSGTMCGSASQSSEVGKPLIFRCNGLDPRSSCPAGYSGATVPIWGGAHGQSFTSCYKN